MTDKHLLIPQIMFDFLAQTGMFSRLFDMGYFQRAEPTIHDGIVDYGEAVLDPCDFDWPFIMSMADKRGNVVDQLAALP